MNVFMVEGLRDADKRALMETVMGMSEPEQTVVISCIPDSLLMEELKFRMEDRQKRLSFITSAIGGNENE